MKSTDPARMHGHMHPYHWVRRQPPAPTQEKTMFTRKQCMDGECSHNEYCAQFVTPHIEALVVRCIGLDAIDASTDPHLNDIPLHRWDRIIGWRDHPQVGPTTDLHIGGMLREAGDSVSASMLVCVMKQAAKMIKARRAEGVA